MNPRFIIRRPIIPDFTRKRVIKYQEIANTSNFSSYQILTEHSVHHPSTVKTFLSQVDPLQIYISNPPHHPSVTTPQNSETPLNTKYPFPHSPQPSQVTHSPFSVNTATPPFTFSKLHPIRLV